MNGGEETAGVDDFLRAQEEKSKDLGAQQQADQTEPGNTAPGAAVSSERDPADPD